MKANVRYISLLVLLTIVIKVFAQKDSTHFVEKYSEAKNISEKLNFLKNHISLLRKHSGNKLIDSIVNNCISLAKISISSDSLLSFYKTYFNEIEIAPFRKEYAHDYLKLATLQKNTENIVSANIAVFHNLDNLDFIERRDAANNAIFYAEQIKDYQLLFKAQLCQAELLNFENKKIDAYRIYNSLLTENKINGNDKNILLAQNKLIEFYINNNNIKKAELVCEKQRELITKIKNVDSLEIIKTLYQVCQLYNLSNNTNDFYYSINFGIDYCIRHGEENILYDFLVLLRKQAFDKNDVDLINDIYFTKYPQLLKDINTNDTITYYKIMAMRHEANGTLDSAVYLLTRVEEMNKRNSLFSQANFSFRMGEFFKRNNSIKEALVYFNKSYQINLSLHHYPWIKNAANQLSELYAKDNNMPWRNYFTKQTMLYDDSIKIATNNEKQLEVDIENETLLNVRMLEKEKAHTESIKNTQYLIAFFLLIFLFLILMISSSTKFPRLATRALAYISFILLFETIILIADEYLHKMTHGEPLKILSIKIVLIGLLLPFHHWIEHKVLQYLYNHTVFQTSKIKLFLASLKAKIISIYKPDLAENSAEDDSAKN